MDIYPLPCLQLIDIVLIFYDTRTTRGENNHEVYEIIISRMLQCRCTAIDNHYMHAYMYLRTTTYICHGLV